MTKPDLIDALERGFDLHPLPYRLGVAVSGGSDSLGLLHLLAETKKFALSVVTVNHGLRPAAASEALHVARLCDGLSVPQTIVEWQGWDGRGNLQDQARRNRYSLIADWARTEGVEAVALGHTRDDVAETLLMRLARASGVDGLSAMPRRFKRDGMVFLRPLLDVGRAELRVYLGQRKVTWVDDPSNEDDQFERVRARDALAALTPLGLGPETLAQVAQNLSDARDALASVAAEWVESAAKVDAGDIIFDRTALNGLPAELRRRIVSGALRFVSSAEYGPRRDALAGALDAITSRRNHTVHGCLIMVSDMTVRITREAAAVGTLEGPPDQPWDRRWRVTGPDVSGCTLRALGDELAQVPGWRETRRPRASLLSSPAIWDGDTLVAAPVAGLSNGWSATAPGLDSFAECLIAH